MRTTWASVLLLSGCLSGEPPLVGEPTGSTTEPMTSTTFDTDSAQNLCEDTPLRVATFNVRGVGFVNSVEYLALANSLLRIRPDVVCLQEVSDFDIAAVGELAELTGFDYLEIADQSPPIGGEIRNACMTRVPMTLIGSFTGRDLSPDITANDVGRDILAVRVEPAPGCSAGVFTVHLKSGGDIQDTFRRAMEVERLVVAIEAYRAERPNDAVIVGGDFNVEPGDDDLGALFMEPVSGLPGSYDVGQDIAFPVRYDPFMRFSGLGFQLVDATWEDSTSAVTWNERSRLDYIWYGQALVVADEVYNSCQDDGV